MGHAGVLAVGSGDLGPQKSRAKCSFASSGAALMMGVATLFARETEARERPEQDLASGAFLPLHALLGAPAIAPGLRSSRLPEPCPWPGPAVGRAGGSGTGIVPHPSPSSCAGTSLGMGTVRSRQAMAGARAGCPARGTPVQRDQKQHGEGGAEHEHGPGAYFRFHQEHPW